MSSIFETRTVGTAAEGTKDQYADGIAAKVWEVFIGDKKQRKQNYKDFLVDLLKKKKCKRILDIACGTGVDSIMLLEEGFEVIYCFKVIEEANWLTLSDDIRHLIGEGFDAVICLGNSFAHMLDSFGDQREQRQALSHFERCVKPGGLFLIDHRNYDHVVKTGKTPTECIYYNSKHLQQIVTSVLYTNGTPSLITLEYRININIEEKNGKKDINEFRLSYYPHMLSIFTDILNKAFHGTAKHSIYGDFKPLDQTKDPGFYIHILEKPSSK